MSKTLDLKLTFFDEWQAKTFLKVLRTMEFLGNIGHCGDMTLKCDGDGNFKLKAQVKTVNGPADWPTDEYTDVSDIVKLDYEMWKKAVKEHQDLQATVNPEVRDNSELQFNLGG